MRRWICLVALATLTAGCSAKNEMPTDLAEAAEANRQEQVDFFDSKTFDTQLSAAMRNGAQTVIVRPASPFNVNDIPERLDKWFFTVQDGGGNVVTREEEYDTQRGAVSAGVDVVILVTKYYVEKRTFGPAKEYDVVIHHSGDGLVQKVTFLRH